MIHHLQIIGEAANRISETLLKDYPEMKWKEIISMRNIIVHEYFGIDPEEIWNTIQYDIPELKQLVLKMIANLQT